MNDSATLVMTTVDTEELAKTIGSRLLEKRLAACVQEIVAVPVVAGLPAYLKWLAGEADGAR